MNPQPEQPHDVPRPASAELLALAAATRPDWDPHALREALAQARTQGITWGRALVVAAQLMADPRATPSDLLASVPQPWRRRHVPPPELAHRGAAAVRAALHNPKSTSN